jgi:large subunit ribosomal protein L24
MTSVKSRKQRYRLYNAPLHKKRKWIAAHLAENLLLKYDRRSLPVVKGDTVKVMRGNFRGHEDKIAKVNVRDQTVEIEGVIITNAKGEKIAKPIHACTLLITKLNVTDKWRRQGLEKGLSETTKKELEEEAAEQIKEREAEEKAAEEARLAEEKLKEEQEKAAEEQKETPSEETEPAEPKEETEEAPETPEEEKGAEPEKPAEEPEEKKPAEPPEKKPAPKKTTPKKTTAKKEEDEP